MSQELQIGVRVASSLFDPPDSFGFIDDVDVTGARVTRLIQVIGTSEEAINTLDAGVGGTMVLRNKGTVNITVHPQGGAASAIVVLPPGRTAVLPLHGSNVPYATATGSSCDLEVIAFPA